MLTSSTPDQDGQGSTVAGLAAQRGLRTLDAALVRDPDFAGWIVDEQVDLLLNVHSLHIAHPSVVAAPRIGSFNLHPGPLPRYAGLDAPSWAISEGERRHAVTVHWMDPAVDAGAIAYEAWFDIGPRDTGLRVAANCVRHGCHSSPGSSTTPPAVSSTSRRPRRTSPPGWFGRGAPHGGLVPWGLPARRVVDLVRAADYAPFPSPWGWPRATLPDGTTIEVTRVAPTGDTATVPPGTIGDLPLSGTMVATADEWVVVERARPDALVAVRILRAIEGRRAPRPPPRRARRGALERGRRARACSCTPTTASSTPGWCRRWCSNRPSGSAPLVAVQPVYMHPYAVAKMVTSLGFLHGRRVWLNMLAGGFRNDLVALGDDTPHDERYERTTEYTRIVLDLLQGEAPVTVDGRYATVADLRLTPPLPPELMPGVLISGSSPAGLAAARTLGITPVKYPQPPGEEDTAAEGDRGFGVRVGIVARATEAEAWAVAHDRFPEDRTGQITHKVAMAVSGRARGGRPPRGAGPARAGAAPGRLARPCAGRRPGGPAQRVHAGRLGHPCGRPAPAARRGEVLPTPTLCHRMRRLPHVRFTNLYGPTEATIASSHHTVAAVPADETQPVPIGTACAGEELLVLDDQLRPAPPGEIGDLFIAGVGLSPGYWRDDAKTAAAFLPDPRHPGSGRRIYRTGDLARVDTDGLVHFLGRAYRRSPTV